MENKAIFLDRDGVINIEKNYLYRIEDFEFINGAFETLKYFQDQGYMLIVITNQAGIGRGYYALNDFWLLNNWMLRQFATRGIHIAKTYYSPYHPQYGIGKYKKDSFCRKPSPGMILQAQKDFNIDLSKSILIGDKESDIEAGLSAGVKYNILVQSGHKMNVTTKAYCVLPSIKECKSFRLD